MDNLIDLILKDINLEDSFKDIDKKKGYYLQEKTDETSIQLALDTTIYTEYSKYINNTEQQIQDASELADYRHFPREFLINKGISYAESVASMIQTYLPLKNTSMFYVSNYSYTGKYILPIRLPNRDIVTFMGYSIDPSQNKYTMPFVKDWEGNPKQGSLLGNLESLSEYPSKTILVCEGFFDSYRCNVEFNLPSIALLGSVIGKTKRQILQKLKYLGYKLVYIPDIDKKGSEIKLLKDKLWDSVVNFTKYANPELEIYKYEWIDIDDFFILHKKNNLSLLLDPKEWKF